MITFSFAELLLVSFEIEPPETHADKQKYHELKYKFNCDIVLLIDSFNRGQLGSYARCIGKKNGSMSGAASTLAAFPMYKSKK